MKILILDVGGAHVKCIASGRKRAVKFKSDAFRGGFRLWERQDFA